MNTKSLFPAAALAVACVVVGCNKSGKLNTSSHFTPPSGPTELKLKWPPGERIIQNFDMTQDMVMALPGRPEPMKQDMDLGQKLSLNVLNANPDGGHQVEMQFLSARVSMQIGQKKINYNSDTDKTPGKNPAAEVFSKIIGAKIDYFLDSSNNIERVDGIDDLTSRLSSGAPATAQLKGMFNETYFKQMMSFTRFMPPGPVQPGDTWPVKIQFPVPMLGNMDMDYTFNFARWEMRGKRNCAQVEFSGTIQTEPGTTPGANGMSISIQDGSITGIYWFDPEFGTVIDSKMNQDMTMLITVPSGRKPAGTGTMQTITNQLTQVINFKVDSLN